MSFIDDIKNRVLGETEEETIEAAPVQGGGGPSQPGNDPARAEPSQDIQHKLEQKEERIEELERKLNQKEGDVEGRLATIESELVEEKKEKQQIEEQLEQTSERLRNVQQTQRSGTTSTPPPDSSLLKGRPVVSADGGRIFGYFVEWINEMNKIGVLCEHPRDSSKRVKVGWAETPSDLVVDTSSMRTKDVVICKLDQDMQPMDLAPARYLQEIKQEKERYEDMYQRVSQENDELIDQNKRKDRLNQKLLVALANARSKSAANDDINKDIMMSQMANDNEMMKMHLDNLQKQKHGAEATAKGIVDEYESLMSEMPEEIGRTSEMQSLEEVKEMMGGMGGVIDELGKNMDPEVREDFMSLFGGGGDQGGNITFTEED